MPKKSTETQDTKVQETGAATKATAADEANFLNAPVVALAKFDPHYRPATTRESGPTPIRQSYEDIQREAKGPGSEEWRAADKARAKLSELHRNLQEDERYALVGGVAFRSLVAEYRVSKDSLSRHKPNHLPAKLVMAQAAEVVAQADDLLEQLKDLKPWSSVPVAVGGCGLLSRSSAAKPRTRGGGGYRWP